MSLLIPLAIFVFLISPFAISGYRRAWRAASVIWILLASYTGLVWSRPIPAYFDEQDKLGAGAWQMILLILVAGSAAAFALGFAIATLRSQQKRDIAKEAIE